MPEQWLLIEWPAGETEPTKYWLGSLAADTSLTALVTTAKQRWMIERDYEELKQELGLGHHEGRGWRGFHHHALDADHRRRLDEYARAGVEVRELPKLPMKLAVLDSSVGLIALLDPVLTKPTWTAVVFEHPGFAEAMHTLFTNHWRNARRFS